ncbi:unnamed protein product [Euphydryas editha]|uniref:Uncharacterized protein n=1 Tax=Euphydryas editha TaxID=104508 RepID=A0AAU9TN59_EUPED|nr:unnamed protein product [Euphydryas editha]
MSNIDWHSVINVALLVTKWKRQMESDNETLGMRSFTRVRWAIRRDSLPLTHIRKAWLKRKQSISHDALLWRRR